MKLLNLTLQNYALMLGLMLAVWLSACAEEAAPLPTSAPRIPNTATPTPPPSATPVPTLDPTLVASLDAPTPVPNTWTPSPTPLLSPTRTLAPTSTPFPSPTPLPTLGAGVTLNEGGEWVLAEEESALSAALGGVTFAIESDSLSVTFPYENALAGTQAEVRARLLFEVSAGQVVLTLQDYDVMGEALVTRAQVREFLEALNLLLNRYLAERWGTASQRPLSAFRPLRVELRPRFLLVYAAP